MSQITEAEASREIYRVHLPGAENDLYSLLELRELALRKVIKPGTLISREGQSFQAPASSMPTVFSTASAGQWPILRKGLSTILWGGLAIGLGSWVLIGLLGGGGWRAKSWSPLNYLVLLIGLPIQFLEASTESDVQIDEAEAGREIYRVHLPGAENDLYSLLELRQMALKNVITPRTPISIEGENIRVPAGSIHTVYSPRSTLIGLVLWCLYSVAFALIIGTVSLYAVFIAILINPSSPDLTPIYICLGIAGTFRLPSLYQLLTGTAVDRQGRPLR